MKEHHSALSIIIGRSIGFIMFVILLLIASLLAATIQNPVYSSIINFFNANIPLFFSLLIFGIINEIFWNFEFPFSVLAPITSAILSTIIVSFIYNVWQFMNIYTHSVVIIPIDLISLIVFIIVIVAGYAKLAKEGFEFERLHKIEWRKEKDKIKNELKQKKRGKDIEWDDVENQFKVLFYNLGDSLNKSFEKHAKRKKRRR
ncbi:MAG: hypothetical protein WAU65_02910 [Candidatus Nanoarchaeia archaeon]